MTPLATPLPLLAVLAPLAGTVPILALSRRPNGREAATFVSAGLMVTAILSMLRPVMSGSVPVYSVLTLVPGVDLAFRVDPAGMLFGVVASLLWVVTSVYSVGYMRGLGQPAQTRYYTCFAVALGATAGVAFAANLLTLYLFYEMLSLATYPLVAHHQDEEGRRGGRRYLAYILGTSIGLVLPAMLVVYLLTGTLDFRPGGILEGAAPPEVLLALLGMFLFGFAKAALMPVHSWLPAAMVAPTPVSALLHAVAVVKVGVFSLVRVLTGLFGTAANADLVCAVAAVTVLAASALCLAQDNLKRLLAFSTIAQLAYILLGVGMGLPRAVTGGMLHIAMHAFGKITLFFCAGAIYVATGKKDVHQLKGLGRRMPLTMGAFFVGTLSIVGLPPTGGFLSKWYMLLGALEAGKAVLVAVILASSLLKAAALFPVVYAAFFLDPEEEEEVTAGEGPLWCVAPPVFTALASVWLFFQPQPFLKLAELFAGSGG